MHWSDYLPALLRAAGLTVAVALGALLLALLLGVLGATCKLSGQPALRRLAQLYTAVVRGVPDLVLMLIVFYGGQVVLNRLCAALEWSTPDLDPASAGVLSLGLIYGGFFSETFRAAFLAVPRGQLEAALVYGMRPQQCLFHILLPQMLRFAMPGIANNWLVLLKSTAIVSMIGLADMSWLADQAGRATGQPFLFFMLVCGLYLALSALSELLLGRLVLRYAHGAHKEFQA